MSVDLSKILFRQAAHYTKGPRRGPVELLVIHTAEVPRAAGMARRLMKACATTPDKKSWHYAVDRDEITQSVKVEDIAWHAPGANSNGLGIELVAYANKTTWQDDYSIAQLNLVADLFAALAVRFDIPAVYLDSNALFPQGNGRRGITTHAAVSLAYRKSSHTDPGPLFPIDDFVTLVAMKMLALAPPVA